jgi:hypothetical protein
MNESEYYACEFTDTDLNLLADAGGFNLDESGFFLMPTQKEMQQLAEMGDKLLFIDWFRLALSELPGSIKSSVSTFRPAMTVQPAAHSATPTA